LTLRKFRLAAPIVVFATLMARPVVVAIVLVVSDEDTVPPPVAVNASLVLVLSVSGAEKLIVALERQMDVTGEFGQRLRLVPIDFGDGITLSGLDRRLCVRRHRIPPWEGAPTDTGRRARRINITVGRTRENLGGSSCCDRFQRRTARRLSMLIQISSTMTAPMKAPMIPEG
jgi:hypothetical protein